MTLFPWWPGLHTVDTVDWKSKNLYKCIWLHLTWFYSYLWTFLRTKKGRAQCDWSKRGESFSKGWLHDEIKNKNLNSVFKQRKCWTLTIHNKPHTFSIPTAYVWCCQLRWSMRFCFVLCLFSCLCFVWLVLAALIQLPRSLFLWVWFVKW